MPALRYLLLVFPIFFFERLIAAESVGEIVPRGHRQERNGWIYLHVEGGARERGVQHGYLLAKEISEGLRNARAGWEHESAMSWDWLVGQSTGMFLPAIDPENLAEIDGIAEGARAAGRP